MQKNNYLIAVVIAFLLVGGLSSYWYLTVQNYTSTKKLLRFNYVVKNESEKFIADSRFVAAVPMHIEGIQSIESINSSHQYQIPKNDTQSIEFPLKDIVPYSTKIIDLTLVVELTNKPKSDSASAREYVQPQKYIESDLVEIKELAAQLKGKTSTETARNIHQWLVNNVSPSSYTADSKGAAYLLKNKTGDCTEFMYTFIALARANEIPARGINGFWIPGDSSLINAADYHDWAEFYDGDRWVLVDASKDNFDKNIEQYVVLFTHYSAVNNPRFLLSNNNMFVSLK